jgi:hypothetical protein
MTANMGLWRAEIDSLWFKPQQWDGGCAVHRLAFRSLLGRDRPTAEECIACFRDSEDAFHRAALNKIAIKALPTGSNLHLTSRDIIRALRLVAR